MKKYFEDIPAQPAPKAIDYSEPAQTKERRVTVEDPFAAQPAVMIVFKTARSNTPDYYALDTLMNVLGGGKASRLYQVLVKNRKLATSVSASIESSRGVSLAQIQVMPQPGADFAEIEKAIYAEIDRTKKEPPEDWEMEQATNQTKLQAASLQGTTLGLAIYMAQDAVFYNEPGLLYSLAKKVGAVKKSDITRVAAQYLTENNRSVITALPKPKAAASPATTTK